jgi:predicted RNase H-related nuclease YkuK (DUF458 family)
MNKKTIFVILTMILIQSCNIGSFGVWKNNDIDVEKREQIKLLNDKLFNGLKHNDASAVKAMMSDKLLEKSGKDMDQMVSHISSILETDSYRIMEECNVKNSTEGLNNTIPAKLSDGSEYVISYQALNKEMYASILLTNGPENELMILAIYGKYGDQWKLNILQLGQYSIHGKTAPYYYELAKKSYEKSYLVDAGNYISLAIQCLKPGNEYWVYKNDKEINSFYEKIKKEVNSKYQFPLTISEIKSKPKIYLICPQVVDEGVFPAVYYLSSINLKDTVSLKNENEKIKIEVGKLFKGIDKDKKVVFYFAVNEIPEGNSSVMRYGFIDKLTE